MNTQTLTAGQIKTLADLGTGLPVDCDLRTIFDPELGETVLIASYRSRPDPSTYVLDCDGRTTYSQTARDYLGLPDVRDAEVAAPSGQILFVNLEEEPMTTYHIRTRMACLWPETGLFPEETPDA